ncbi:hypothetical protein KPH14_012928, partial [Odynerus spinipes]
MCGIEVTNLKETLTIFVCYKPPNVDLTDNEWDNLIHNANRQRCILLGDFNSHNEVWNCEETDLNGEKLFSSIEKADLYLHNSSAKTRVDLYRHRKSNIDLVFSTIDISQFIKCKVLEDTFGSDHYPISIVVDGEKSHYIKKTFKIQSKRTEWALVYQTLEADYEKFLTDEYSNLSPLHKYGFFINVIRDSVLLHTPKKKIMDNWK